jgi:peroxiredoxin
MRIAFSGKLVKIFLTIGFVLAAWSMPAHAGQTGSVAPQFTLKDLTGRSIALDQYKGKVVFLDFWAPWCAPCKEELPELEALHNRYAREGLAIIGISLDTSEASVSRFLQKMPVAFPVLIDKNADASDLYRVSSLPAGFLIDRNGIIRYKHLGFGKEYVSQYEKEIVELLNTH